MKKNINRFQDPAYQEYYEQYYAELEKNSETLPNKQQDLQKKSSKSSREQKVS
jgi:hypothetical protein